MSNLTADFVLCTDTCTEGIGGVLKKRDHAIYAINQESSRNRDCVVCTNTCTQGIGEVFMQENHGIAMHKETSRSSHAREPCYML
jgi:hypothetical protein